MSDVTAEIKGLEELRRKFRTLAPELAAAKLEKALKEGGAVIEEAIRPGTPVRKKDGGALVADLHTEVAISPDNLSGQARVGFTAQSHVARFLEFGHRIVTHGALKDDREEVGHVPANPFMRRGFEAAKAEAKAIVTETISNGIKDLK